MRTCTLKLHPPASSNYFMNFYSWGPQSPSCFSHQSSGDELVCRRDKVPHYSTITYISRRHNVNEKCIISWALTCKGKLRVRWSFYCSLTINLCTSVWNFPRGILISRSCKCAPLPLIAAVSYTAAPCDVAHVDLWGETISNILQRQSSQLQRISGKDKKMEICKK